MDAKRILLASMVLVLTFGCTWAATQASGTAGFAVIPDDEAAQIVGGDGYVCDLEHALWPDIRRYCFNNGSQTACGTDDWDWLIPRYGCVPAESGECPTYYLVVYEWGDCGWYPEYEGCVPTSANFLYGTFCN